MNTNENIKIFEKTRQLAAEAVAKVLGGFTVGSEVDLHHALQAELAAQPMLFSEGWYSPPPAGIGVLLGSTSDVSRTKYTSFREESFWAKSEYTYSDEAVGLIHVSPVDKASGIIGDFGMTFYKGDNVKVREHMRRSLEAIEEMAEYSRVGMSFRELYEFCAALIAEKSLQFDMIAHSSASLSFGHTIPWTHQAQTDVEREIIAGGDLNKIKALISSKRLYMDKDEIFTIPKTVAFTTEARLVDAADPAMPNVYFHLAVAFIDGEKHVYGGFNKIFDTLGMNYIRSKYE